MKCRSERSTRSMIFSTFPLIPPTHHRLSRHRLPQNDRITEQAQSQGEFCNTTGLKVEVISEAHFSPPRAKEPAVNAPLPICPFTFRKPTKCADKGTLPHLCRLCAGYSRFKLIRYAATSSFSKSNRRNVVIGK